MPGYIHHIEWCVNDVNAQVNKLITQYGFQIIGHRLRHIQPSWKVYQIIVQSGATVFILTEKSSDVSSSCMYVFYTVD